MRVALDTNVLAYAEGINDAQKRALALDLLRRIAPDRVMLPVQVLGELFNVLVRKGGRSRAEARSALLSWGDTFPVFGTSPEVLLAATDLATDHHLSVWDAIVLAATSHAGCRLLLSEDLQEGFTWGGVTVANPFAVSRHALLEAVLAPPAG
ncbi:PIN domain-containing protein [Verticiella sediminum]|uniref:Ribonuclease VapC n=1 Tax=Verticiella sediminum TaxID=1247510 RepID=A0A556B0G2_9BURK|nr:PIN domain-containing protein [Verticiella sediminum]TSH98643.1 PIN domain-containing protein [Verticiella sediminum]